MANCHWLYQEASLAEVSAVELYVNLYENQLLTPLDTEIFVSITNALSSYCGLLWCIELFILLAVYANAHIFIVIHNYQR